MNSHGFIKLKKNQKQSTLLACRLVQAYLVEYNNTNMAKLLYKNE